MCLVTLQLNSGLTLTSRVPALSSNHTCSNSFRLGEEGRMGSKPPVTQEFLSSCRPLIIMVWSFARKQNHLACHI